MNGERDLIERIERLWRRISQMFARGYVVEISNVPGLQIVKFGALDAEIQSSEHFQPYGFGSKPHPEADVLVAYAEGNRDSPIILMIDDRRHRKNGLVSGESWVWDDQGQYAHIKRDLVEISGKNITIKSDGVIRIEGDRVEISGKKYVQTDVDGYGERTTSQGGGAYTVDRYTLGAVVTSNDNSIDPPDIPSEAP